MKKLKKQIIKSVFGGYDPSDPNDGSGHNSSSSWVTPRVCKRRFLGFCLKWA
jgi:hypothetical protein